MKRVATRKVAAAQLGITARALGDWVHEPWFPPDGRTKDGWDVDSIKRARDAHGRKGSDQSERARSVRLARDDERLTQERLKTQQLQLELRAQRGELLPRAGIELWIATFQTRFGDWCDQLPDLIARDVPAKYRKQVRARLKREFDERRAALRGELEAKARELDQQANPSADE